MKQQQSHNLRQELLEAGAKPTEIRELLGVAQQLSRLKRSPASTPRRSLVFHLLPSGAIGLVATVFVALLVMTVFSQNVLPGSRLYSLERVSDKTAVVLHPSLQPTIMKKRAKQINQLVKNHANTNNVLRAVHDYQAVAAGYKFTSANYAVLDYCRANLTQAAQLAQGSAQQAIVGSLNVLDQS